MKKFRICLLLILCLTICMIIGCGKNKAEQSPENSEGGTPIEYFGDVPLDVDEPEDGNTSEKPAADSDTTVAQALYAAFETEIEADSDIENVANALIANDILSEMAMATMPVEEGYLNGFDGEIKGFDKGIMFSPMIGSIPFVGYVFETKDADALTTQLDAHHQLNWNICTIADEMLVKSHGNYVFFVMSPTSF